MFDKSSLQLMQLFWGMVFLFSAAGRVEAVPEIQSFSTPEGGRVLFVKTEGLPMLDVRMAFDAGSSRDGQHFGIAALTAGMLDSGAGTLDADAIAERLEAIGAILSAGANRDSAHVALRTLTDPPKLKQALEVFETVLSQPRFDQKDFEREKNRVLLGIQQKGEDPGEISEMAFMKAIYGEHPYAHPVEGVQETVETLTSADLQRFHHETYTRGNGILVMVGQISREEAEGIATQVYSRLPAGASQPVLAAPQPITTAETRVTPFPSEQTHVYAGTLGLTASDTDYFPLVVGNHILGGSGLISRIMEEVREKRGLAYSAFSYFHPMRVPGPFQIGLQSKNASAREALDIAIRTLRDFVEKGPSDKELDAAKRNIIGGYVLRLDSNAKLVGEVAAIGILGRPLDWLDRYTARVEAVTREDIRRAFKTRIDPDRLRTVLVGGIKSSPNGSP
jgi:zinc protease